MSCLRIAWIAFTEGLRYLWSRDADQCVYSVIARSMAVNVVFTKVFQSLAVKYMTFDMNVNQTPYTAAELDYPCIEGLGPLTVIGSGMVSVVFEGTLDGQAVVVKTKRKGIASKVCDGIRQAKFIAWVADGLFKTTVGEVVEEVEAMIMTQLCYLTEAKHQQLFYDAFEYNDLIVIPKVRAATDAYIVMDKLTATPLLPSQKELYAKLLITVQAKSIVCDGIFHADVHLGNVVFMDGRLGVLDFGLVYPLSRQEQNMVISFMESIVKKNYTEFAAIIGGLLVSASNETMTAEIVEMVKECNMVFGVREISKITSIIRKYNLRVANPNIYNILLGISTSDSLMTYLSPDSCALFAQVFSGFM
jgi:predicted unusual protein kinase regulating ubiquinone biosynthesis (AarF/ABC1/UbiB family)